MGGRVAFLLFWLLAVCGTASAQNFPMAPYCESGSEKKTVAPAELGTSFSSKYSSSVADFAKGIFLRTDVDKVNLYENELVQVKWVLYYPSVPGMNIDYQITDYHIPCLPDFVKEWNIIAKESDSSVVVSVVEKGVAYRAKTLLCFYMYPSKTGAVSVGSGAISMRLYGSNGKELGAPFVLKSKPVALKVRELPKAPANFSGGIGCFKVETELLRPDSVYVGETATLRVRVKGSGNFKFLDAPAFAFPANVESYPAKPVNNIRYNCSGCYGERVFDFLFIPHEVGTFTVPSSSFSYFDSRFRCFKDLKTESFKIQVLPALPKAVHDDAPVQPQETADEPVWRYVLAGLFLLLLLVAVVVLVRKKSACKNTVNYELKAYDALNEAVTNLQDDMVYNKIVKILIEYIGDKLNYPVATQSKAVLSDILRENGASDAAVTLVLSVINDCEKACYSCGFEVKHKDAIYKTAVFAITQLQRDFDNTVRCSSLS